MAMAEKTLHTLRSEKRVLVVPGYMALNNGDLAKGLCVLEVHDDGNSACLCVGQEDGIDQALHFTKFARKQLQRHSVPYSKLTYYITASGKLQDRKAESVYNPAEFAALLKRKGV